VRQGLPRVEFFSPIALTHFISTLSSLHVIRSFVEAFLSFLLFNFTFPPKPSPYGEDARSSTVVFPNYVDLRRPSVLFFAPSYAFFRTSLLKQNGSTTLGNLLLLRRHRFSELFSPEIVAPPLSNSGRKECFHF